MTRVSAGPYTLEIPPNGVATLYEADGAGVDHQLPGGVGYLDALVQFAGEVIRLHSMIASMHADRSIPICAVTGRISGDSDACGDCDPCIMGAPMVPGAVKLLLTEKEDWRSKYSDAATKYDELRRAVDAYLDYLKKSVNVGPLTKNPSKEAKLLRRLWELGSNPIPTASESSSLTPPKETP